jgi:hypothetical protein
VDDSAVSSDVNDNDREEGFLFSKVAGQRGVRGQGLGHDDPMDTPRPHPAFRFLDDTLTLLMGGLAVQSPGVPQRDRGPFFSKASIFPWPTLGGRDVYRIPALEFPSTRRSPVFRYRSKSTRGITCHRSVSLLLCSQLD